MTNPLSPIDFAILFLSYIVFYWGVFLLGDFLSQKYFEQPGRYKYTSYYEFMYSFNNESIWEFYKLSTFVTSVSFVSACSASPLWYAIPLILVFFLSLFDKPDKP